MGISASENLSKASLDSHTSETIRLPGSPKHTWKRLWTLLEATQHDNYSHVASLLRPIDMDFGEMMEVIEKRFEAAKEQAEGGAA